MIKFMMIIIALIYSAPVNAKTIRYYDRNGIYQGRMSDSGTIFNRNGEVVGRIKR